MGRLWKVTADGQTATYSYYANGNRQSIEYHDGSKEVYEYYDDGQLKKLTNYKVVGSTPVVMDTYEYTYLPGGKPASKQETINGAAKGTTTYTYDSLNRLLSVTEPGGKVTAYTYDHAGNRLTESITQGSTLITEYTYNEQNRLIKTETEGGGIKETVTFSYDDNGNLISSRKESISSSGTESYGIAITGVNGQDETAFYEYDLWNRQVKALTGDTTVLSTYNGEGVRVSVIVNGIVTRYFYEGNRAILEVDVSGNQTARNVYGIDLISRTTGGQKLYYFYNGHGDVTALMDEVGEIAASYYYDPFGNITEAGEADNPIRYSGYQYDEETELYYLMTRMYDPEIARFLQEDTYRGDIYDPLSLNLYSYCHNEPIMYIDPTGRWSEGDSSLSIYAQYIIADYTDMYFEAREKGDDKAMLAARNAAAAARYEDNMNSYSKFDDYFGPVINVDVEKEALKDGIITTNEWESMKLRKNKATNTIIEFGSKEYWEEFYKTIDNTISFLSEKYERELIVQ